MESFLTICGKLKDLLSNKQIAATICIAWVLFRIFLVFPEQFAQMDLFYHEHLQWLDVLGVFASARLILALLLLARPHIQQFFNKRYACKEIKRILNAPQSEDYKTIILLYEDPDTLLNPYAPLSKRLCSFGVICASSLHADGDPRTKTYSCPFQLTHFARQILHTHLHKTHPNQTKE